VDQVEEVKSKVDIVDVISSRIPLKKAGRNFSANCPFHTEKTPSFMVSPDRQVYKCFGCGEVGDVYSFLQKTEGMDFREALEELAKKTGVKLIDFKPTGASKQREKIVAINKLAAKFYSHLLTKHPSGEKARKYLEMRGIKKKAIEAYSLGYAPSGWENTAEFLTKRGYSLADVATSGLIIARDKSDKSSAKAGFYDRFRDRLIFPIKDMRGTILGFSARVITENTGAREPKYINSPETPIFYKGSILYGLDVARDTIRKKNYVLLVEGEFDVIAAHQIGILNVVATKGTALTEKQVALIARNCENVALCFDTDLAGDAAARRGIEMLDAAGVNVKVVNLGVHKDPDGFIKVDSVGFKKSLKGAENIYDYFIESATARFNPSTAEGKKKIGKELVPILSKITDDLVRAHYTTKLAKVLDLEISFVADAVEKKSGVIESESREIDINSKQLINKEKYFLALFITLGKLEKKILMLVRSEDFEDLNARELWSWLNAIIKHSKSTDLVKLFKKLPKDLSSFVDDLYLVKISHEFDDEELLAEEIIKVAKVIKKDSLKRELVSISKDLATAQKDSDNAKVSLLSSKFNKISDSLKSG